MILQTFFSKKRKANICILQKRSILLEEFYRVAEQFGVSRQEIDSGEKIIKKTGAKTVDDLRNKVSMATDEMRQIRAASFFDNIRSHGKIGQGIHDRLEAYIFANGSFSEEDLTGMSKHIPIPILFTCGKKITVKSGECLDLTANRADWDRGNGDDVFSILNVDTLILNPNSIIRVRGNLFVIVCQHLINKGGKIEILPTDFSYEISYHGSFNGSCGLNGIDGMKPIRTAEAPISSTIFGKFYMGKPLGKLDGAAGHDGCDGKNGENGFCGGAVKIAELNLREITGIRPLEVSIQGGCGGNGGDGGNGGNGGDGADPGASYRTLTEIIPEGTGGNGGCGGNGGNGGRGGHGGISSNIYIEVQDKEYVHVHVNPGYGGNGGKGGKGGLGGHGGKNGGFDGPPGKDGKDGLHGHTRAKAAVFINGIRMRDSS